MCGLSVGPLKFGFTEVAEPPVGTLMVGGGTMAAGAAAGGTETVFRSNNGFELENLVAIIKTPTARRNTVKRRILIV